ncbi:Cob(I)alamin adenosyltransferase [Caenispirillum salinarum AK4]|uniref:Corrinoid adenosyltransferase n=1 Tax=Caenispirillum salinarum AK4 TaxID=1238182 RepID=K9HQK1_9PROT|nr:cob(I)yrinic acid a,c-diamide adenosyltransferase [Caenispirillum salinarum]EKV32558.1 Cob(I)alamin adenosyltransferase [Caenispirillum salinarum AK4]
MTDTPAPGPEDDDLNARHKAKMAKKKAIRDKILSEKTETRGVMIVHTGAGKGKSTAAFGMALRCVGHGMKVGVVQFIKGAMDTAERDVLARFPDQVTFKAMGEGFTWETQDRERDIAAARRAFDVAKEWLADPDYGMVILDEINVVLRYGYLPTEEVIEALEARPIHQHAVLTGRNALDEVIERADLVTEMKLVKHPFRAGIKAQAGVEF